MGQLVLATGSRDLDTASAVTTAAHQLLVKLAGRQPSLLIVAYGTSGNTHSVREVALFDFVSFDACVDTVHSARAGPRHVRQSKRKRPQFGKRQTPL